jgi:predicted acyl esterase
VLLQCKPPQRVLPATVSLALMFHGVLLMLAVASPLYGQEAKPADSVRPPKPGHTTVMIPMRDGVKLATDIYMPSGKGSFPVLLMRTPYSKTEGRFDETLRTAVPAGYACVIQDVRGRFASEGKFVTAEGDGTIRGEDGVDTMAWIAGQPWCNGKIGTQGGSSLGMTQLSAAQYNPPNLVSQSIGMAPHSWFVGAYRGGVFRETLLGLWAQINRATELPQLLRAHPTYDAFQRAHDAGQNWNKANARTFFLAGWFDIFLQPTLDTFIGYQTKGGPGARGKQRLVIYPYDHLFFTRQIGAFTRPSNAEYRSADEMRWLDFSIKGLKNGMEKEPTVLYYVMGDFTRCDAPGNVWRTASSWPIPSTPTFYYLRADHSLSRVKTQGDGSLSYAYDPKDPVPTTGGSNVLPTPGPCDQSNVESRPDVLVFTSDALKKPLEVTGRVKLHIWVSSDAPDTDFTAKLCDVLPDGRSFNICDGILRARFRKSFSKPEMMQPGKVYPIEIDLWSTSMIFDRGHRLRVQVSSSDSPAFDLNPNTGELPGVSERYAVAHNTIYFDVKHLSQLILPVVKEMP